jgi:sugar lactone lactonase YvrE
MVSSLNLLALESLLMPRSLRTGLPLTAILLITTCWAWAASVRSICPLEEVRRGQRAVAKSVFRGTHIESFHLEIIGVLHKFDGTRSVILARVLDGPVVTRDSGVMGGMSGSPVYVGGRLAGAIALAWPWSKEPIAGITPIEDMLEAWREKPRAKSEEPPASSARLSSPIMVGGAKISRVRLVLEPPSSPDPPGVMTLVPVGGFMQVSGFNGRAVARLSELLLPYGMQVVQGPGGAAEELRPPLIPGAALGARLVGGDFDMTVLGTVTLVEGERVLGFGHPLFQLGNLDLPMTGGYVHDILPSRLISSKIMAATQVVGRVYRDHQSAIAGEMGARSDLVPINFEVNDREMGRSRRFDIEVVRMRELLPALVAISAMTAIDETRGRVARGTTRMTIEIEVEGMPALRREEISYSDRDAAAAAVPMVLGPLVTFTDNPFGRLHVKRVSLRIASEDERKTASIERVTVARSRVEAGDEVTLNVMIHPYGADAVEMPVRLRLPVGLPRGRVRIVLSSGADAEGARAALGAPKPGPVSLRQLVERYVSRERACDLVLQAALTRGGVSLRGEELPGLPRSALDALRSVHPTDLRALPAMSKVVVPTEWLLTGRQVITLDVESRIAPAAPGPPFPPKPPMEAPPGEEDEEEEAATFGLAQPGNDLSAPFSVIPWEELAAPNKAAPGEEDGEKKAPKEAEAKPLTRAPGVWVHESGADHAKAELQGVAVSEDGRLSLAPGSVELGKIPADVVWSVAVREGVAYVGTGSDGKIYSVSESGEASEFFATGEMNVHALAFDDRGNLYAGTSPRGRLFRIGPDGKGELIHESGGTCVWCMSPGPDGTIYFGTGLPARISAMASDGSVRRLVDLPAANVLSLVYGAEGDIYAGTSDSGVVYRVRPDGSALAICQVSGSSVDALAMDDSGNVYAGSSPRGHIYLIPAQGVPALYCETDEKTVYGIAVLPDGDLVAATGPSGRLLRIGADRRPQLVFEPEAGLATALAQVDDTVYVGYCAPSVLRRLGSAYAASGSVESAVLDAERPARWGRMDWSAVVPEGTEVRAETRSGDSPDPEANWSPWVLVADGAVASPAARYLQYRLNMTTQDSSLTPTVRQVRVSYRPQNRRPTCSARSPSAGDRLSKKCTVKWQSRDPDKDELVCDVSISDDLGETWKELETDLTETKYEWDTSESEDGRYLLRVTASDRRSAPDDPQSAEASLVVWVDNGAPEVAIFRSFVSVGVDRRGQLKGWASDKLSPLRSVEYRVDEGEWTSLPLVGIEGLWTSFSVTTDALEPGDHTIEVRAFDAAGNQGTDKAEVTAAETKSEAAEAAEPTKAAAEEQ